MTKREHNEIVKLSEKLKKYAVEMPLTKHSTEESPIPEGYVSVNGKKNAHPAVSRENRQRHLCMASFYVIPQQNQNKE